MPSRKKWICKQAAVNEAVSILPSFNLGTYSLLLGFWEKSSKLFLLYLVTLVEYFSYHISQKTGLPPPCIRYDIYTGVGMGDRSPYSLVGSRGKASLKTGFLCLLSWSFFIKCTKCVCKNYGLAKGSIARCPDHSIVYTTERDKFLSLV